MSEKICGIYKITSPTGKVYIGQSRDINKRIKQYSCLSCKKQPILYKSIFKHGFNSHNVEIIEKCIIKDLNKRERYWQEFYDVLGVNGLNCCLTKTDELPRLSRPFTQEHKQKISKALKGRIITQQARQKLREANLGKKASKETKKKMSDFQKKQVHSKERRENMSRKKSKSNHHFWGKKLSEERISKLKGRSGSKNSMYKPIFNLQTGVYYDTLDDAAFAINISKHILRNSFRGLNKIKTNFIR